MLIKEDNNVTIKGVIEGINFSLRFFEMEQGTILKSITLDGEMITARVDDVTYRASYSFNDEEINRVCEYVNASYFINKLEKGLDEEVIEKGENNDKTVFWQALRYYADFAVSYNNTCGVRKGKIQGRFSC